MNAKNNAVSFQGFAFAIPLAALLIGCSSVPGGYKTSADIEDRLNGQSKEFVVSKIGAPNERVQISPTIESWTYTSFAAGLTGGTCKVSITFVGDTVKTTIVNAHDRSWVAAPLGSCMNLFKNL